ncbi:MAG TPA: histidine kinase dimerization/phospho-acceptor domain-containing protein, partial [Thermoanaerobaculia bacterium]|nr:histidine kinase dimerization/phospho-acceptor domain-containing protein [Thermoanaerobaculia bacterium]
MTILPPEPDRETDKTGLPSQVLHDLRSPLNQIIGYSEILIEEVAGQRRESFGNDLQEIRAAGHRMLTLIEENFTALPESFPRMSAVPAVGALDPLPPETPFVSLPQHAPGLLLVVDDDAANRAVLSRRLKRQGHEIRTAHNGSEAL